MMFAIACFALVLPALTLSQGYSEGYFPSRQYHHEPTVDQQYDYGSCGGRVCASNGYRYANFANICRLNDYNLRLVFAGHAEFVEVDPIYCHQPPIDVGYYYRPQPAPESHRPGYSPHVPCIPMTRPHIGPQHIAQSASAFAFSGYSSPAIPFWFYKPAMSPTRPPADSKIYWYQAPHTSKRPVTYYYPTTSTESSTTSTTNDPSTTTTESSTTITTNDPSTTTTESSTTSTTNDPSTTSESSTTSTTNDPSTTTTTESSTTTTTNDPSTTTNSESSTTSTTNDPSTTTSEASTTSTTNDPSTTTSEASTTSTTNDPSTTTSEASTTSTTNDPSTTTSEASTTSTTNDPSTTTATTESSTTSTTNDPSTTTTSESSTTTNTNVRSAVLLTELDSAVDPVTIQITGPNGKSVRLVLSDLEAGGSTCTDAYTLDVTRGSTVLFQFTGCADANTASWTKPSYLFYHTSTSVVQT